MNVFLPPELLRVKGDHNFFERELRRSDKGDHVSIQYQEGVICFREEKKGSLVNREFLAAVLTDKELLLIEVHFNASLGVLQEQEARRTQIRHRFKFSEMLSVTRGFEGVEEEGALGISNSQQKILKALGHHGVSHSMHIRILIQFRSRQAHNKPVLKGAEWKDKSSGAQSIPSGVWFGSRIRQSRSSQPFREQSPKKSSEQLPIELKNTLETKKSTTHTSTTFHILTSELDSLLLYRLKACWFNSKLRKVLKIPYSPPSAKELASRYVKGLIDSIYAEDCNMVVLKTLQELSEELQVDLAVKDAFFNLDGFVLLADLLDDADGILYCQDSPPSWEEVYQQLEIAAAVYSVAFSALFECESLTSRFKVLRPLPYSFDELLDLFLKDYTAFIPGGLIDELLFKDAIEFSMEDELKVKTNMSLSDISQNSLKRRFLTKYDKQRLARAGPLPVTPAGEVKDSLLYPSFLPKPGMFSPIKKSSKNQYEEPGTLRKLLLRNRDTCLTLPSLSTEQEVPSEGMKKVLQKLGEEIHDFQPVVMMLFQDLLFSAQIDHQHSAFDQAISYSSLSQYFFHIPADSFERWINMVVARIVSLCEEIDDNRLIIIAKHDDGRPIRLSAKDASVFKAKQTLDVSQQNRTTKNTEAYRLQSLCNDPNTSCSKVDEKNSESSQNTSDSDSESISTTSEHSNSHHSEQFDLTEKQKTTKLRVKSEVLDARVQTHFQAYSDALGNEKAIASAVLFYHISFLHFLQQDHTQVRETLSLIMDKDIRELFCQGNFLQKLQLVAFQKEDDIRDECDYIIFMSFKLLIRLITVLSPNCFSSP